MTRPLLIFGASARAAAFSALQAGYAPIAADLFGDADLRARCEWESVPSYPKGLRDVATKYPDIPWLYTGALENEPRLVDEISRGRSLWGNPGAVLRNVRDPRQVSAAFDEAGIHTPRLAARVDDLAADIEWLSKPIASCAGMDVYRVDLRGLPISHHRGDRTSPEPAGKTTRRRECYFQQLIAGTPCGAVYVAAAGRARLVGITRQLVGKEWNAPQPFQYAGSWGPVDVGGPCGDQFRRIGDCLAARFGLVGLFGVDAIVAGDTVWPLEVNPRYTASIEVLERALSCDAMGMHAAACQDKRLPDISDPPATTTARCGKAILYAQTDIVVRDEFTRERLPKLDEPWPQFADIPVPGTRIEAGQPVLTVFARASREAEIAERLRERLGEVRQRLGV